MPKRVPPNELGSFVVLIVAVGLVGWFLVARPDGGADGGTDAPDRPSADGTDTAPLPAGTYRLPGLTLCASCRKSAWWEPAGTT